LGAHIICTSCEEKGIWVYNGHANAKSANNTGIP